MKYLPLSDYRYVWFYQHKDLPVSDSDLELIKPLTEVQANNIWRDHISQDHNYPDELAKGDWAAQAKNWQHEDNWQSQWDGHSADLPELVLAEVKWDDSTVVYFCYSADHIVESTWAVFKRCWKNFLFLDDGPILIGKKRKEALQFRQNGTFRVGLRP